MSFEAQNVGGQSFQAQSFRAEVRARPREIADLADRAGNFLAQAGVDARATHHVAMILSELLTNLGTHGGTADDPAIVRISIEPERVLAEINDAGPPFDPRSTPAPDLSGPAEDIQVGGLGLFLMRKLASEVDYGRSAGRNRTTFAIARSG